MSEHPVFRPGGISYLRIPATDPQASAAFYEVVFGWRIRGDRDDPAFEDGTTHVIGHFRADHETAGDDPAGNVVGVWQHGPRE